MKVLVVILKFIVPGKYSVFKGTIHIQMLLTVIGNTRKILFDVTIQLAMFMWSICMEIILHLSGSDVANAILCIMLDLRLAPTSEKFMSPTFLMNYGR